MAREPIRRIIPNIGEPIGFVQGDRVFATDQFRQWMEAVERQLGGEGVDAISVQEQNTETVTQAAANLEQVTEQLDTAVQVAQTAANTAQTAANTATTQAGTATTAAANAQTTANSANTLAANVEARINAYSGTGPIL